MPTPTHVPAGTDVLADAVRRLVDAVVRTQVPAATVTEAAAAVDAVTAALSGDLREGPYTPDLTDPFGNPVSLVTGPAHPYAPPVRIVAGADGATARFRLGSTYEGPPGLVHGGMLALVLDHVLGQAALGAGHGGMTVSLELTYLAPTPIGSDLVAQAHVVSVDGRKVSLVGSVRSGDTTTVTARGLFLALDREKAAALFPHLTAS